MNTRKFSPDDIDAIVDIFRSNVPKYFVPGEEQGLREFLSGKHAENYYVYEVDTRIVGGGGIGLNDDNTVSLCWGMIHNDRLGTGLGKKMTEFRIELAREKFPDLPMVISTSQHTVGFYEKLGFKMVERKLDGFAPGIDDCRMILVQKEE